MEITPVPVQIFARRIFPSARIGSVGVDHWNQIDGDIRQRLLDTRLLADRHPTQQPKHRLG